MSSVGMDSTAVVGSAVSVGMFVGGCSVGVGTAGSDSAVSVAVANSVGAAGVSVGVGVTDVSIVGLGGAGVGEGLTDIEADWLPDTVRIACASDKLVTPTASIV